MFIMHSLHVCLALTLELSLILQHQIHQKERSLNLSKDLSMIRKNLHLNQTSSHAPVLVALIKAD